MLSVCEIDNAITQFAFKIFYPEKLKLLVRFVQIITGIGLAGKKIMNISKAGPLFSEHPVSSFCMVCAAVT